MLLQRNISTPLVSKKQSIFDSDQITNQLIQLQQNLNIGNTNVNQNGNVSSQQTMPSSSYISQLVSNNTPLTSALSASIYCQNRLIYSKNGSEALEIASLTKVMTFFTSLKLSAKHELDPQNVYVRVPKFAAFICGTSACLRNGEYIKLCDLFYALMLPSGNDAACTLANFFGQLELRKPTTSPSFFNEETTQTLADLYGFNSKQERIGDINLQRQSEISTDTQGNDSKDSGEEETNSSGEVLSQRIQSEANNKVQQIQQDQQYQKDQERQLLQAGVEPNVFKLRQNKAEGIKFHQQQGDSLENMKCFVKLMNQEAQRMQMRTTQYSNPHGLSDKGNKSSANDYGKLCFAAMSSFALFREVVKTPQYTCQILLNKDIILNKKNANQTLSNKTESNSSSAPPKLTTRKAFWENTNKLLKRNSHFIGIKTGNTPNAGPCLATHYQKNGIDIQVIVLKCKDSEKRWSDSQKLAEWAFQSLQQEYGSLIQTENLNANGRLMSAQRNRKIKFQQQFQDEFTKLLHQNKDEDPSSKSQLMADFNQKYRPKSTIQVEHSYQKTYNNANGAAFSQVSCNNLQQSNCSSSQLKGVEKNKNNSNINNNCEPSSQQYLKQNGRRGTNSTNCIRENNSTNSRINNIQLNFRANKSQIINKDTDHYEIASNTSSIQLISCEDFDCKNQGEEIELDENNLSFEKHESEKVNDIQILSESFEEKMEELIHLKAQSQQSKIANKLSPNNNFVNELNNKKFSSQNNLDLPTPQTTMNSCRKIEIKLNTIYHQQQNIQKPKTAVIDSSHHKESEGILTSNKQESFNMKLVSPRRKVIYAKSQMNSLDSNQQPNTQQNTTTNNNATTKKLVNNNIINRGKSGRQFDLNLIQGDKKLIVKNQFQGQQPLLLNNYSSKNNSTKNMVSDKKLPRIINKSIIFSDKKFSEDITSPLKQNFKILNQSVIKTIFQ